MGLKKYEIITVGNDRRVRALRSWQVGDRYVNIGDTGGIVYDEKTLSQDGACWLFRGNFGFPGARIGGDSIVDVAEAALSAAGTPAVDILGSSVVVGSKLQFALDQTAADAVVLKGDDFEQGLLNDTVGVNWEGLKENSPIYIRTKNPIFAGGTSVTLKCGVPGYLLKWFALDRDGVTTAVSATVTTGAGVTTNIPPCQYFLVRLTKNPAAATVPADATTAAITFTGTYETKLSVIDSRVEINPATSTAIAVIMPGGIHTISPGVKYPDSVIRNSKVSINGSTTYNRIIRLMSKFIGCNVAIDATQGNSRNVGIYSNVNNLTFTGELANTAVTSYDIIQVTDCNDFAVSPAIFPGLAAALSASKPFIFQGCNVPGGRFQHDPQINNTYINIDFAKAQTDLNKVASGFYMCSSNVEGMYRLGTSNNILGCLVESYESIKSFSISASDSGYSTTIYKDAFFSGKFDFAGTNVFGNKVPGRPRAVELKAKPRVVQGTLNTLANGSTVTGVTPSSIRVVTPIRYRINFEKGISVKNLPAGIRAQIVVVNEHNVIEGATGYVTADTDFTTYARYAYAFVIFSKPGDAAITPDELGDTTITVYNGCKIVNTGATAINMKGSIRVEDNATLVNASVTGTGYFGGNSVTYYNPAVWAALECTGSAFMKDNAVFAPTSLAGACAVVHMQDNAKFIGSGARVSTELSFIMRDNAIIEGVSNTRSAVVMSGNAKVTSTGAISANSRGVLVMEDNASIEAATTVIGAITLAGNYKGNVVKTWTGKRTITDVNEPEYDNNVKTQYEHEHDF